MSPEAAAPEAPGTASGPGGIGPEAGPAGSAASGGPAASGGLTAARGSRPRWPRAPWFERAFWAAWAVGTVFVLALALRLEPDGRGVGTHEQLGLPACGAFELIGGPCPSCGFTTTFALAARGRLVEAGVNQPFGLLLFAGALALGPLSAWGAWRGVSLFALSDPWPWGRIVSISGGLWLLAWAYKWWRCAGGAP